MNNLSISHTVVIWYCGFSTCDVSVPWLHTKQPRSTVCCMLLYTAYKDSMHQAKILVRLACASALCRTKQHLCPCFISFNGRKVIGQTQTNKGASMNLKHIKCNLKTGRRWGASQYCEAISYTHVSLANSSILNSGTSSINKMSNDHNIALRRQEYPKRRRGFVRPCFYKCLQRQKKKVQQDTKEKIRMNISIFLWLRKERCK